MLLLTSPCKTVKRKKKQQFRLPLYAGSCGNWGVCVAFDGENAAATHTDTDALKTEPKKKSVFITKRKVIKRREQ